MLVRSRTLQTRGTNVKGLWTLLLLGSRITQQVHGHYDPYFQKFHCLFLLILLLCPVRTKISLGKLEQEEISSVLHIGPRIHTEHQVIQEQRAGYCLYGYISQLLDHREVHLVAVQRNQTEQLTLCWRLSVLG